MTKTSKKIGAILTTVALVAAMAIPCAAATKYESIHTSAAGYGTIRSTGSVVTSGGTQCYTLEAKISIEHMGSTTARGVINAKTGRNYEASSTKVGTVNAAVVSPVATNLCQGTNYATFVFPGGSDELSSVSFS